MNTIDTIQAYHQETKHHVYRYARSLGYLDWENQPNPFRYYEGAKRYPLDFIQDQNPAPYHSLFIPGGIPSKPLQKESIANFFRYAMGLSAWKSYGGERWALRVNPSSGNLHPSEAYAVFDPIPGLLETASIIHYSPQNHEFEIRGTFPSDLQLFPDGNQFLVGLTSIHWREAWKYGERAFRYCQHDAGHALAALRLSAALQGWSMTLLPTWSTQQISSLFGLDRTNEFNPNEREEPDFLALIQTNPINSHDLDNLNQTIQQSLNKITWHGHANSLSQEYVHWPIIDQAADATQQQSLPQPETEILTTDYSESSKETAFSAKQILLQRRSALDFDPAHSTTLQHFLPLLARTLPGPYAPWDCLFWPPHIHLAIFVHQVKGLEPGFYVLVRNPHDLDLFQKSCKKEFLWEKPLEISQTIPLYLLERGDFRELAAGISCGQSIAGNSYFSLGMIAKFTKTLQHYGPWFYKNLFWETGIIGQLLYLEAENQGARATGIGCYFDDTMHDLLGLQDSTWQSLYHFTIGFPINDPRLTSIPPYERELFDPTILQPF